jgi:hypothetical protein
MLRDLEVVVVGFDVGDVDNVLLSGAVVLDLDSDREGGSLLYVSIM